MEQYKSYLLSRESNSGEKTLVESGSSDEKCSPAKLIVRPSQDVLSLNKTERQYYNYLRSQDHLWIGVQNITLKLAHDTRLTPDFTYLNKEGDMVFVDVKGFQREDALIKMKVAARQFPWASFVIVSRGKNGSWIERKIKT